MAILRSKLEKTKLINYKLPANKEKGSVVQVNNVWGIVAVSGKAGDVVPVVIESDLIEWDCDLDNYAAGEKVYLDTATLRLNKNITGVPVGYVYEDKSNAKSIDIVFKQ